MPSLSSKAQIIPLFVSHLCFGCAPLTTLVSPLTNFGLVIRNWICLDNRSFAILTTPSAGYYLFVVENRRILYNTFVSSSWSDSSRLRRFVGWSSPTSGGIGCWNIYNTELGWLSALCMFCLRLLNSNTVSDMSSSLTPQSKWSISPYDSLVPMQSGKHSKQLGPGDY